MLILLTGNILRYFLFYFKVIFNVVYNLNLIPQTTPV